MNPALIEQLHAAAFTVPTDAPEADGTIEWEETILIVVHVVAGACAGRFQPPAGGDPP